jgi:hypothetical protein
MGLQWAEIKVLRVAVVVVKIVVLVVVLALGGALVTQLLYESSGAKKFTFDVAAKERIGKCFDTKDQTEAFESLHKYFQTVAPLCPCCITREYTKPKTCTTKTCMVCKALFNDLKNRCDTVDLDAVKVALAGV